VGGVANAGKTKMAGATNPIVKSNVVAAQTRLSELHGIVMSTPFAIVAKVGTSHCVNSRPVRSE
jgi:hypothetical protein